MSKKTKEATQETDVVAVIEAWFFRRFGHITPGTPDHATALAAKVDLVAALQAPTDSPQA